jgi:hypothetical protein
MNQLKDQELLKIHHYFDLVRQALDEREKNFK